MSTEASSREMNQVKIQGFEIIRKNAKAVIANWIQKTRGRVKNNFKISSLSEKKCWQHTQVRKRRLSCGTRVRVGKDEKFGIKHFISLK